MILALVYYRCPMLCTQILNGLASSLKAVSLRSRQGFRSRHRQLRPQGHARNCRAPRSRLYLKRYGRPDTANGWHFLTGDEGQHQGADRRRGLPLQVRSGDRPVRARQRHHDSDARGPALALLLRRGIRAARRAPGPGGGVAEQDRHRRSTRFCCSATTTTRPPASTAPS